MHEPPLVVTNTSTAPVFVLVSFSCAAAGGSNKNCYLPCKDEDWKELLRGLPVKMRRGSVSGPCHSFCLAIGGGRELMSFSKMDFFLKIRNLYRIG